MFCRRLEHRRERQIPPETDWSAAANQFAEDCSPIGGIIISLQQHFYSFLLHSRDKIDIISYFIFKSENRDFVELKQFLFIITPQWNFTKHHIFFILTDYICQTKKPAGWVCVALCTHGRLSVVFPQAHCWSKPHYAVSSGLWLLLLSINFTHSAAGRFTLFTCHSESGHIFHLLTLVSRCWQFTVYKCQS